MLTLAAEASEPAAKSDPPTGEPVDLAKQVLERPARFTVAAGYVRAFMPRSISDDGIAASVELRPARSVAIALASALLSPFDEAYLPRETAPRKTEMLGRLMLETKGFVYATPDRSKEVYVLGGLGMLAARPLSIRNPSVRRFDWASHIAFDIGAGARIALGSRIALFAEARATSFIDRLERQEVGDWLFPETDKRSWFGEKPFTTTVDFQVGVVAALWK